MEGSHNQNTCKIKGPRIRTHEPTTRMCERLQQYWKNQVWFIPGGEEACSRRKEATNHTMKCSGTKERPLSWRVQCRLKFFSWYNSREVFSCCSRDHTMSGIELGPLIYKAHTPTLWVITQSPSFSFIIFLLGMTVQPNLIDSASSRDFSAYKQKHRLVHKCIYNL